VVRVSRIFGEQLFPERQLLLKSSGGVHHIALPGWLQAMVLVACLVSVGGIAYLATGFARLHEVVDQRIDEARSVSSAAAINDSTNSANMDSLRAELAQMRRDLATVNQNYADVTARYQESHDKLTSLASENDKLRNDLTTATTRAKDLQDARDDADRRAKTAEQALNNKSGNVSQLTKNLDDNKTELRQSEAERTTLQNRVQQLQMELQAVNNRAAQLAGQIDAKDRQQQQQQIATDPARVQPAPVASAPAPIESAEPLDVVAPVPERKPDAGPHARAGSSELEKLLVSTGIDIDRMLGGLSSFSSSALGGQGGPYIALGSSRAVAFDQQREDDLKKLAKMLPLAAPLVQYQFESGFGLRIDPINHRTAFHPGLDLSAPYQTPVYSTAPGTVTFTGTRDAYGRMVEIDHGHGIVTRYAHLHRILVARGQKIGAHVEIGELGSTGRSTGPHVHYEVLVDGTPLDPAKFMEVGKNVVQISGK
jgi:murein DD-endopeptidase MepM/ murein hydrolase activator NlpD